MSAMFKMKHKKPMIGDNRVTLDAKHNEMIKHFKEQRKLLPAKLKELNNLRKKYAELEDIQTKHLTNEQLHDKFLLADSISNLESEIEKIEQGEDETDYFLQTGHLLYKYYNNIDEIANKKDEESFINLFSNNNSLNGLVKTKESFQRADIYDNYLKIVDPSYIGIVKFDNKYDKCDICNCEMTLIPADGIMICESCGKTEMIIIDSDRPSYKDPPPEASYFAYKRSNHFVFVNITRIYCC